MTGDPRVAALPPVVVTDRLVLRPLRDGDRDEVVRAHALSVAHLAPWMPAAAMLGEPEEVFERLLAGGRDAERTGTGCRRVAVTRRAGREAVVGFFNLNNIVRGALQGADAGWSVYADALGQGFATEGVTGLLDLAFAPPPLGLGLHRVQANIIPGNARSLRVGAKCGFRREGLALRMIEIAGSWQDHVMHAKLADEHRFVYLRVPGAPAGRG